MLNEATVRNDSGAAHQSAPVTSVTTTHSMFAMSVWLRVAHWGSSSVRSCTVSVVELVSNHRAPLLICSHWHDRTPLVVAHQTKDVNVALSCLGIGRTYISAPCKQVACLCFVITRQLLFDSSVCFFFICHCAFVHCLYTVYCFSVYFDKKWIVHSLDSKWKVCYISAHINECEAPGSWL